LSALPARSRPAEATAAQLDGPRYWLMSAIGRRIENQSGATHSTPQDEPAGDRCDFVHECRQPLRSSSVANSNRRSSRADERAQIASCVRRVARQTRTLAG
jgi:hypothetical protein